MDAQCSNIQVKLRVIVLHLGGGGNNTRRAIASAAAVGGRAVIGDRDEDHAGGFQRRLFRSECEEVRIQPMRFQVWNPTTVWKPTKPGV